MPPEPFSWDRREEFRGRRRQRSEESFYYYSQPHEIGYGGGGVMGIGVGARWREPPFYPNPYSHPYRYPSPRCRPPHPGYGKQGSQHLYPEDGGHKFVQSRPNDRFLEDERFRTSRCGRYARANRETRPSYKVTKADVPKAALSPIDSGRPNDASERQKQVDDVLTYSSNLTNRDFPKAALSPIDPGRPNDASEKQKLVDDVLTHRSNLTKGDFAKDAVSPLDPVRRNDANEKQKLVDDELTYSPNLNSSSYSCDDHSESSEKREKNNGLDAAVSSGCELERVNYLGSNDWKTLKWTRTGSFSLRSCSNSHSSGCRSMAVDRNEMKAEVQQGHDTPVLPSGADTDNLSAAPHSPAPCEAHTVPSENMSCKRRRLGWGEGLAKYEKKRIEHTDDSSFNNSVAACSNISEQIHALASNLTDKIPRINTDLECSFSAAPSTVNCSPSPVSKEKHLKLPVSIYHDKGYLSASPVTKDKQLTTDGRTDHAKANSNVKEEKQQKIYRSSLPDDKNNLSFSSTVVPQNHVQVSNINLESLDLEAISLNSTANDLPIANNLSPVDTGCIETISVKSKNDILTALELTESEIDKLECQLQSTFEQEIVPHKPSSLNVLPGNYLVEPLLKQKTASNITREPASVETVLENKSPNSEEFLTVNVKDEDVEVSPSGLGASSSISQCQVQSPLKTYNVACASLDAKCNFAGQNGDKTPSLYALVYGSKSDDINLLHRDEDKLCHGILASNRESALRAEEVFNKLLSAKKCASDSFLAIENNEMIKGKFLKRKRFLQFKERVLALKFRASQHLWKEDVRLLSMRRFHVKGQKRMDQRSRPAHSGFQKYRSSVRSRIGGSTSLIANTETINFVSKLISNNQVKPLRKELKMPALILDEKEKRASRFLTKDGFVENPQAVEREGSLLNPWSEEEKEIFMDKLSTCGKDFTKIASFLIYKTTAECIEFYYKNHKSEWFRRPRKKEKDYSTNNFLISSGKQFISDGSAPSVDTFGAATVVAATADDGMGIQQKIASKSSFDTTDCIISRDSCGPLQKSDCRELVDTERETLAADVLAGISDSLISGGMSSCITSATDPREVYLEHKARKCATSRLPLTTEVSQCAADETCSGESFEEMDYADWTDEEKSCFIQAVSSYGKDFAMISRCIRTRTVDQCKIFFSKARKCMSVDAMCPVSAAIVCSDAKIDANGVCVEAGMGIFTGKSGIETEGYREPDVSPVLNSIEHDIGISEPEAVDSKFQLDNSAESLHVEKPEQVFGVDGMGHSSNIVTLQCESAPLVPSWVEAEENMRSANNMHQSDSPSMQRVSSCITGQEPVRVQTLLNKDSQKYVDPRNVCVGDHERKLKMNGSRAADLASSGNHDISEKAKLCSDSSEKSCVISLQQMNYPPTLKFESGAPVSTHYGKFSHEGTSLATDVENSVWDHQVSRAEEQYPSGHRLLDVNAEWTPTFEGHAPPVLTARKANGDVSCVPRVNRNFHLPNRVLLRRCNGIKQNSSVSEIPVQSVDQFRNCDPCSKSDASSEPSGNFKLFGEILTQASSQQKLTLRIRRHGNSKNHHEARKSSSVNLSGDTCVGENSALEKLDNDNLLDSQNPRVTSLGRSRILAEFSSLPETVAPQTMYSEAFTLQEVNGGKRKMEGLPNIPVWKICSRRRVI